MAAAAELCPQCGASIQFAAYQTQVICPYCGTPVPGMRQESIDMDEALRSLHLDGPDDQAKAP